MQPHHIETPRPPRPRGPLRPLGGWQRTSAILIGLTTAVQTLNVAGGWAGQAGPWRAAVDWTAIGVQVLTAAAFLRWLWLARVDAEVLDPAPHRHRRSWVVAGWIVPIVSLWYPQAIVRDIWNATHPARPRGTGRLAPTPGANLVGWWWAAFLTHAVGRRAGYVFSGNAVAEHAADVVSVAANVAAAVLIVMISGRITGFVREGALTQP